MQLPSGLAFSLPAGMALMGNAHYINATPHVFDAQSVVDVKMAAPSPSLRSVGFIAVNWAGFTIPAGAQQYAGDAHCTATSTLSFFMWGDHMHEYGSAESSELIRSDGTVVPMASDSGWTSEQTFNTPWVKWDPSAPFVVNPGDQFHLHCVWNNTTIRTSAFRARCASPAASCSRRCRKQSATPTNSIAVTRRRSWLRLVGWCSQPWWSAALRRRQQQQWRRW